jgi:multidrug efflux pump subunit AcrA (membrane-fusion protein)
VKKKIFWIIIIIIVLLGAYRIFMFITKKGENNKNHIQTEREIPVKAVAVKEMDIVDAMNYSGDIVGTEVVDVYPQVPGKIKEILARDGQKVFKGQTLFKIDRDVVGMEYMPAIVESPITGYIGKVMVDVGRTVAPAVPLAQVVNMYNVKAVIYVIEKNINKVELGMTAEIKVAAFKDRTFYGKVYKKSAVVDPMNRTLEIHILLDNKDLLLKHGMFADVKIIINKKNRVKAVPVDAVITDENNKTFVMTVNNGRAVKKPVETGIDFEGYKEILTGLSLNEIVVTLGKENVADGSKLLVYREDAASKPEKTKNTGEKL